MNDLQCLFEEMFRRARADGFKLTSHCDFNQKDTHEHIRKLFDAGIKVTIASDDPAYMEDNWLLHNLLMVQDKCKFTNQEMAQLQRNAISVCWASDHIKQELLNDLDQYENLYR